MSDESKWTPGAFGEPIATAGVANFSGTFCGWIKSAEGKLITTLTLTEDGEESAAFVDRIVACVNACAGIADPSGVPALVALARTVDDGLPPRPRHLGALFLCDSCGQYASHREVARNRGSADCPDRRECGGTLFQVRDTPEERIKVAARALLARVDGGAS